MIFAIWVIGCHLQDRFNFERIHGHLAEFGQKTNKGLPLEEEQADYEGDLWQLNEASDPCRPPQPSVITTEVWWRHIKWRHHPGGWFNTMMSSYQYRKSHCGDKTVVRSSYLHNAISYTGKMTSLYWIRALIAMFGDVTILIAKIFGSVCRFDIDLTISRRTDVKATSIRGSLLYGQQRPWIEHLSFRIRCWVA